MISRFILWSLVALLCGFGLVMIASTTASMSGAANQGVITYSFLYKQAVAMAAGIFGAWIVSRWIGAEGLRQNGWVYLALGATVLSLIAVLAIGRTVNGAKRWIDLGPINLQPAELAKLAVVIGIAWYFTRFPHLVRTTFYGVIVPLLGFALLAGLVYLTKDLGSVVVMAVVLSAMLVFAGVKVWQYAGICLAALPLLAYQAAWSVGYRRDRMLSFMDPLGSDGPTAYHLKQSFIAIGSGGIWGVGLGEGSSKLGFVPEKHTDFIYAVVCEEFGFAGGMTLAAVYLALICTGMSIAAHSRDLHRRLLAIGAVVVMGFQAFGNMLVVTGAVPTKGMTLPFISYGGTSVAVSLVLIGILDAVARANAKQQLDTGTAAFPERGAIIKTQKALRWQTSSKHLESA
jgi:cell division protein FtsW